MISLIDLDKSRSQRGDLQSTAGKHRHRLLAFLKARNGVNGIKRCEQRNIMLMSRLALFHLLVLNVGRDTSFI